MSFNNSSNGGNNGQGSSSQRIGTQQKQLLELTAKFKALVNEAKNVGENTPRGKELLMKASRIKAVYDNYHRQRQQAAQAFGQARNNNSGGATPASSGSSASIAGPSAASSSGSNSGQQSRSGGSQLANIIKQVLTPEQNQQHEALSQNFQVRVNNIRDKHSFLKQHIEKLSQEISKHTDAPAKKQLEDKKAELSNNLKMLSMEYSVLQQEFQNSKKKFYVECARHNPALQKLLQRTTQQQRIAQQQQQQQQQGPGQVQAQHQPQPQSQPQPQPQPQPQTQTQTQTQKPQPQLQPEVQVQNTASTPSGEPGTAGSPAAGSPAARKNEQGTPINVTTQKLPQQGQARSQSNSSSSANRPQSQVTNVNATASMANKNGASKSAIFKQSDPLVPISETLNAKTPSPIAYKTNRPTLTSGTAMNAAALNTPAMTKLPPYEVDTDRVMSKRKLRELVKTVGIDEGDGETVIDGDVEELLLDLADDFVSNVTGFACRLAKHRKSDNLDTRDIQLHLERNWSIRIPGYSADEIRSTRKWNPTQGYNQKVLTINSDKTISAKNVTTASGKSISQPK